MTNSNDPALEAQLDELLGGDEEEQGDTEVETEDTSEDQEEESSTDEDSEEETETEEEDSEEEEETEEDDLLGKDDEDEEWDGKSPLHEHPRFKQVVTEKNEERQKRLAAEDRVKGLEALQDTYLKEYAKFENPARQLMADKLMIDAMTEMKSHPTIVSALRTIQQYYDTGRIPNMNENTESNTESTQPTEDPRLERVLRKEQRNFITSALSNSPIDPKFQRLIANHVIKEIDSSVELTASDLREHIQDFMDENGLTRQDLVAKKSSKKKQTPPTGKVKGASKTSKKDSDDSDPDSKTKGKQTKSADELFDDIRQELMAGL